METDVVVIGAGLAGFSAALEAAATGAHVLLLEGQPKPGGSSVLSGGSFAFAGTAEQESQQIRDTAARLAEDMRAVGGGAADDALVEVYAANQLDSYRWLVARGVTFGPVQAASGQSVPRQHPANPREVIRLLAEEAAQRPEITLWVNAKAQRLHRDPRTQRVTRLRVVREGTTLDVTARRAVVLASGGFSRSPAMLETFAPGQAAAKRVGGAGSLGEGLKLAWALGAGMRDMGYIKGTFGNHPDAGPEAHTAMLGIYKGAIAVNRDGHRFANESISYKLLGDACLAQPGAVAFQILDQGIMDSAVAAVPIFNFQRRLDEGLLFREPSLEALARRIGVDPAALVATVEAYNAGIDTGRDAFGRTGLVQGFGTLRRIETAPFFAYPSTSAIIATYCGLTVDPAMRVLDVFGAAIDGLYAAGEITGGFHGKAFMTGTSLGKCVICGRIAGRHAALAETI
jgi:fumarate reductase flavoprotein subunit